ncbi:S-layer homology domain-containing protein [Paenibacillus sp. 1011MAR3C5]|uniref:S-layer homology domain-containing protein n=1 Tax=Paenibacillus sp. 1011MAR3C5 TaxID=1675787 RepID=UPI0011C4A0EA|nr:S-layer homology domain-containing protein [Paenibacillus sp. 1011MAR3C5]
MKFDDVAGSVWYYEPVRIASSLGIVTGKSENRFDPKQMISRADIAVMVVRAFKETVEMPARIDASKMPFADVSNHYARLPIGQASTVGIVNGKKVREFKPNDNAKRAEAVVMLSRALSLQIHFNTVHDVMFSFIQDADKAEYKTLGDGAYDQLENVLESYVTGYYLAALRQYADDVNALAAQGVNIVMEEASSRTLTMLASSDRFVAVQSMEGSGRRSKRYRMTAFICSKKCRTANGRYTRIIRPRIYKSCFMKGREPAVRSAGSRPLLFLWHTVKTSSSPFPSKVSQADGHRRCCCPLDSGTGQ